MSHAWLDRKILVTVGTGGVGKTSVAAALGIEAAARGKRALVLTIDPARRLAHALGLETLDHTPRRIPDDRVHTEPARGAPRGELHAMMLDTQRTFDELVQRFAPDPATRERILTNPIYRNLTDSLSGSREYSALEKLHQLHGSTDYDLIVLDTPPASHSVQFLDAPRRLTGFLDGSFLEALMRPAAAVGRTSFRLMRRGSELALRSLERVTGLGFLRDLSEFFLAFETLLTGLRERAREVERLMRDPACGFVLVAGPNPAQVKRAGSLTAELRAEQIRLIGLVLNRVHMWQGGPPPASGPEAVAEARGWLEKHLESRHALALAELAGRHADLAQRDAEMCDALERSVGMPREAVRRIELLAEDIHRPEGLAHLRRALFPAR
jgi:anion-transporting  ArsA/GET3 family ATPase